MKAAAGSRWPGLVALVRSDLLARRDFRLMWLASTVTSFGGQITMLALPLTAVLMLDATPRQMGWLVALETLPFSLFSLHAGVLIDRTRKRPIIIGGETVVGLALLSIPVTALAGWLSMTLLYVVGFVLGTAFVLLGSASQVYLTQIAGRDRLIAANSLFIGSESTAKLTGPGLAGLLIQWLSAPLAILFDCLAFMASLVLICKMRHVERKPLRRADSSAWREIREGLALVLGHPVLRPLTYVSTSWFVVFQGWNTLQTLYATRELGLSAGQLGVAHMIGGIGALLAAATARRVTQRFGTGMPILIGVACSGTAWLAVALIPQNGFALVSLGAALFLLDFGSTFYWINYASLRQAVTPDGMLGRMTATMRFFTVAAAPLGALAAGHVAEAFGVRTTLAAMGALVVGMVALLYFRTGLRHVPDVALIDASPRGPEEPLAPSATSDVVPLAQVRAASSVAPKSLTIPQEP